MESSLNAFDRVFPLKIDRFSGYDPIKLGQRVFPFTHWDQYETFDTNSNENISISKLHGSLLRVA